ASAMAGHEATVTARSSTNVRRLIRSPRRRGRRQVLTDLRQQLTRTDGLGHVGIATRRTRLGFSFIQLISCDANAGYNRQRRVGLRATGCFIPVEARQLNINEDEVRPMRCRRCKACLAVFGLNDLEISAREQIPQDLPIVWLILNHEDALGHCYPVCAST